MNQKIQNEQAVVTDPGQLVPGRYLRTWANMTIPVSIVRVGESLREITPNGNFWQLDVLAASGAVWQPMKEVTA